MHNENIQSYTKQNKKCQGNNPHASRYKSTMNGNAQEQNLTGYSIIVLYVDFSISSVASDAGGRKVKWSIDLD